TRGHPPRRRRLTRGASLRRPSALARLGGIPGSRASDTRDRVRRLSRLRRLGTHRQRRPRPPPLDCHGAASRGEAVNISTRRLLYWLAATVALLVVGTIVGLIWADTSNVAGAFAGVTNVISVVGIVVLLIALAVKRRRRPG